MKKIFFILGLMAIAAVTLTTNCSKSEIELQDKPVTPEVINGIPFEILANSINTKTVNDGMSTKWAANDGINLFHREHGTTGLYGTNDHFTITSENLELSKFTGTITEALEDGKTYDWYALYPYNANITTPANTSTYYMVVGGSQVQGSEATATAHLCGTKFPVYGKVEDVAKATQPTIPMKPAMSVVKVHVTNNSGAALTVNSVTFATEDYAINGSFYIDFTGNTPVFTEKSGSTGKSSTLTVTGGKTIANSMTGDFYIGVAPFAAASGKKLTITVNGYSKELTLSSATSFEAGKIKTINFNYNETLSPASLPFSITGSGGSAAYSSTTGLSAYGLGSDYSSGTHGVYITKFDNTGDYIQLFCNAAASSVSFAVKMIGGATASSMKLTGSADGVTYSDIETFAITGAQNDIKPFTSSVAINDTYRYFRLTFTKGANVGLGPFSVASAAAPSITAANISDVAVEGVTGATTTYTINNFTGPDDVMATPDGIIVTDATVTSAGTVTYTVDPNYTTTSKNGTITLSSPRDGAEKVINVTQLGETFSVSETTVYVPKNASTATFTVTTASFGWKATVNEATGKNLSADPTSGAKSGSAQTITVTSTTDPADEDDIILGTIVVGRTADPADDPQKKTVTIKKAPLATVLYSCGFESSEGFSTGTNYKTTVTQGPTSPSSKQWRTYYGTVSTSSNITGSNSLAFRRYYDDDNLSESTMLFDVTGGVTKVQFNAKASTSNGAALKLTIEYSTDSGTSWNIVSGFNAKALTSSAKPYNFSVAGSPTTYRLRFKIDASSTKPTTGNAQMTIDDVKFLKSE